MLNRSVRSLAREVVLSAAVPCEDHYDWRKVIFFGATSTNLFEQCLRRGGYFTPQSLMLYAFLLHLIEETEEFPRRLRMLRNLIVASEDEVRSYNMPTLIRDVEEIIVNGDLGAVTRFRRNQVEDERRKQEFLDASPELADALFRLNDHPILPRQSQRVWAQQRHLPSTRGGIRDRS